MTNSIGVSLDGLKMFINCYYCACALAVAKSFIGDNGDEYERVRYLDDIERIGLQYSDLIKAIETQGAINISGC
jgi:hypothetical protein